MVINRREFLEGAAVSALPAIAAAAQRTDAAQAHRPLAARHAILIDERHAEARSLGARLAAQGAAVRAIPDGDVTQVWLQVIGPAWHRQPVAVAGLTARPALFCLEQLAWTCGLRVIFHSEHIVHQEGRTEHRLLRGAQAAGLSARTLALAGPLWPARIAEVIAHHPAPAGRGRFGPSEAALSPLLPAGAKLLTAWVIA